MSCSIPRVALLIAARGEMLSAIIHSDQCDLALPRKVPLPMSQTVGWPQQDAAAVLWQRRLPEAATPPITNKLVDKLVASLATRPNNRRKR